MAICDHCTPTAFMYGDSLNQVIVTQGQGYGIAHTTTDGGQTWKLPESIEGSEFSFREGFEFYSYFSPGIYCGFFGGALKLTLNSGRTWSTKGALANAWGGRMFTPEYGMRLLNNANTQVRFTFDSGVLFIDRGATWEPATSYFFMEDSLKFWRLHNKVIYRSWDQGYTWQSILPMDSTGQDLVYRFLLPTSDTNRYYLVGGVRNKSDYFVTSDGGVTWENMAPITGGRVCMIAEQSRDKLWLLVSKKPAYPNNNLYSLKIADTLYYSSDDGVSWQKDLTFVGDTVSELQFHGPNIGFVVSTRDSTVRVWKYVEGPAAVNSRYALDRRDLNISPMPVAERLQFHARLSGRCQVRILNLLGQCVHEQEMELPAMQNVSMDVPGHLPNGIYFLELVRGDTRASQRFILQR